QRASPNFRRRPQPSKLPGAKEVLRIGKGANDLNTACAYIHLAIRKQASPFVRIDGAIRQNQVKWRPVGRNLFLRVSINLVSEVDVLLLADGEIRLDGIYLRDRRENRRRSDKIADLHLSNSGDAIDQRLHLRELQVQLCLLHLSLGGLDRRLRRPVGLNVVVQLALRYCPFFGEWRVPVDIHCGLGQLSLSLCQLGVRLFEHSLKGTRVNLKKNLTLADKRAFFVALPDDVSRHLGLDLSVYVAIERRNPFAEDWNVLL